MSFLPIAPVAPTGRQAPLYKRSRCEKMATWVEAGGFGDNVTNVHPDADAGVGAVPCLWFKIKEAVEAMRDED